MILAAWCLAPFATGRQAGRSSAGRRHLAVSDSVFRQDSKAPPEIKTRAIVFGPAREDPLQAFVPLTEVVTVLSILTGPARK